MTSHIEHSNKCAISVQLSQRQLRYIEWKGVKIYDFQKSYIFHPFQALYCRARCADSKKVSYVVAGPPKSKSNYLEMHTSSKCLFLCIETFFFNKFFILKPPTMSPSLGPICTFGDTALLDCEGNTQYTMIKIIKHFWQHY